MSQRRVTSNFQPLQVGSPKVIDFSDRTQAEPLQIDPLLDQDRIDPLSVLQKDTPPSRSDATCDAAYRVYDGKRRYSVLTQGPLTDQPVTPDQVDAALSLGQAPPTTQVPDHPTNALSILRPATRNQSSHHEPAR